ncbi:MAG: hypothetical protein ACLQVL_22760 [Terriglobia bacterium]
MSQYSRMDFGSPKRKLVVGASAIALVMALWPLATPSASPLPASAAPAGTHGPYSTNFPRAENPISEGGKWINGQTNGLDWANVRTIPGLAFGMEIGGSRPEPQKYDDSTALLTGAWGPNQTVQATVHSVNQNPSENVWEEVELRLRSSLSPHNATGYEVMFRCSKSAKAYCNIARWDGALGKFTYVKNSGGSQYGVANGDVIKATMIGNVITVYINGVQMVQATDNAFKSGNPGMGFFIDGTTGENRNYGFSNFMATDR